MEVPKSLSDKHPELPFINQAILEWESKKPITATCLACHELLSVTYIEPIRTLWVTCPNACTNYHEIRSKTDE